MLHVEYDTRYEQKALYNGHVSTSVILVVRQTAITEWIDNSTELKGTVQLIDTGAILSRPRYSTVETYFDRTGDQSPF